MQPKTTKGICGPRTRQIVKRLQEAFRKDPYRCSSVTIFHDHGDSYKTGVCRSTAYMGRRFGADATLSVPDIVLVKKGRAFLFVEVEEGNARPKTILGDIFGVLLSDRVRINGKTYPIKDATLIVAMIVSPNGQRAQKYIRMERHLRKYLLLTKDTFRQSVAKIFIITSSPDDLVRRIERLIRWETGKRHL